MDVAAFEALFRDHQSEVYRWIMRIVRDPSVAEELTLETFWRVWKAADRFDPQRGFEPWARRIATNLAITHLRHRPREIASALGISVGGVKSRVFRAVRILRKKLEKIGITP